MEILTSLPSKIVLTLALAALCGWAFRFGGSSNGIRWVREAGVGLTEVLCLSIWFGFNWWMVLIMGLAFTESTYFKSKGQNAKWWNWALCGICYSLIALPLVFCHVVPLGGFIWRFLVLTPIITLWRTFQGNVQWSEDGAGAWQILTIPILLIK